MLSMLVPVLWFWGIWDIQRIIKEFGDAAERMKEGGMDGVELEGQGHSIKHE